MVIKAGTTLILEHGGYIGSSCDGPYLVLKDIDQDAVRDAFLGTWRDAHPEWEDQPGKDALIAWLADNRYIKDVPCHRWCLPDEFLDPSI